MSHIVIPFRVEALVLENDTNVYSPLADFTKLPGYLNREEYNPTNPFLGQTIAPTDQFSLPKGLHLHFIIPSFLGSRNADFKDIDGQSQYPPLPNRWIIKRTKDGSEDISWIIESDYVFPEQKENPSDGFPCIIPTMPSYDTDGRPVKQLPYRYMGRQALIGEDTGNQDDGSTTFKQIFNQDLTVIGYGDIHFTSFYPNCLGAFGFYDKEITEPQAGLSYKVIGYYESNDIDPITLFSKRKDTLVANFNNQLESEFGLKLSETISNLPLDGCFLSSKIIIDSIPTQQPLDTSKLKVSIGDTGSEALSALLANELADDNHPKNTIEDQIESILLFSKLTGKQSDIQAKLNEARHEKGFSVKMTPFKWSLKPVNQVENKEIKLEQIYKLIALTDIDTKLIKLNTAQQNINKLEIETVSRKEQLYMDWCNYMKAKYHDKDISEIEYSVFWNIFGEQINFISQIDTNTIDSLKKEIDGILNQNITVEFPDLFFKNFLQLINEPTHSYYTPNEPVLLIEGLENTNVLNFNDCHLIESIPVSPIIEILPLPKHEYKYSDQHLKPFLLDWEVSYYKSNLDKNLTDVFSLEDNYPDYTIKTNYKEDGDLEDGDLTDEKVYNGLIIISDTLKNYYLKTIESYIKSIVKKAGKLLSKDDNGNEIVPTNWREVKSLLPEQSKEDLENPLYLACQLYQNTLIKNVLSQSISGFNNGCITRFQTQQIPIYDPLNTDSEEQGIIKTLADTLARINKFAPTPTYAFCPFISGSIKKLTISLYDNFGFKTLKDFPPDISSILKSNSFTHTTANNSDIYLKPRVVQSSRVEFNWVKGDDILLSNFPLSSPICGWIVPNLLENEIIIYDSDGKPLGSINSDRKWLAVPNKDLVVIDPEKIDTKRDPSYLHLIKVINWLINNIKINFIDAFNTAQNNIEHNISFDTINLVMAKPIAITRASIKMQLQGLPVLNQNTDAINSNINSDSVYQTNWKDRAGADWANTKIAYRLGEHAQLSDGLIGYWFENTNGLSDEYLPETTLGTEVHLLSYNDDTVFVTMLVDPGSLIHLTTGVLPIKTISLLPEWYKNTLKNIEVWFKTGPLIQSDHSPSIALDLPEIDGYKWKWLMKDNNSTDITPVVNGTINTIEIKEGYLTLNLNKYEI